MTRELAHESRTPELRSVPEVQVAQAQAPIVQEPTVEQPSKQDDSLYLIMNEIKDLREQLEKAKIRKVLPEKEADPMIESYRDYIKPRLAELKPVELRKNRVIMDPDTFYNHYCEWIKSIDEIPMNKRNFRLAIVDCDHAINRTQMRFNGERKYTITIQRDWFGSS